MNWIFSFVNKWVQEGVQTGAMAGAVWLVQHGYATQSDETKDVGCAVFLAGAALSIGEKLYANWSTHKN